MKKTILSMSVALLIAGGLNAQTVIGSENFNATSGIALPTGWSIVPLSPGNTSWKTGTNQDLSSQYFSFPADDGRLVAINDDAAGSGVDNSDALLETPVYDLTGQTAAYVAFDLFFQAASFQSQTESLTVEASTDGGSTWTVLATMAANQVAYWETRYVALGSLNGQSSVKFGFRYSDGGGFLYGAAMDNFKVFVPVANDIALSNVHPTNADANAYGSVGGVVPITGTIKNMGSAPLTTFNLNYKQGNNATVTVPQTMSPALALGGSGSISNVNFTIPSASAFPLKVWVSLPGDMNATNDSATAFVQGVTTMPVKKLVFEEGTGTWCGWCPRGSVKMEDFANAHPGVASQIAVHNGDPMTVASYDAVMGTFSSSYPSILVDRTLVGDPGDVEQLYTSNMNNFGFATVTLGTVGVSGTAVTAPVTIVPSVDIAGGKLALVVTESNVTGTGNHWPQHNYYSGGASGPMGGYENQADSVYGVRYQFVARSITPSATGDASGLPATMNAGSTYTANLTATLNPNWNTANLQYIVLLIGPDGKVMNSDFSPLPTLLPGLPTAITNVEAGINDAFVYPNPASNVAYLTVNAKDAAHATINVVDAMGRTVASEISTQLNAGKNTITIPTASLASGMYMINMNTGKGNLVFKLQVVK